MSREALDLTTAHLMDNARERFGLHDYFGAIHILEELIAGGKAFADAHQLLGVCYQLVGQPARSMAALDEALRLNPRYAEALVHRAIVLNELGRSEEADEAFRMASQANAGEQDGLPQHHAAKLANLHAEVGEAYASVGALKRAIDEYQKALQLGPRFQDLRYRLGRLLLDSGRALEAQEAFAEVLSARPGSAETKAALGLAAYLSGDAGSARRVWREAASEHPEDARLRAYLSMLDRAVDDS